MLPLLSCAPIRQICPETVIYRGYFPNIQLLRGRILKIFSRMMGPRETFSLWHLVGKTSARKGYKEGLLIRQGKPDRGIGGGLCQLSNLIHWIVLHTPFETTEHHHHDGVDLFPDFGRQVPFGVGTSISYNYLDYRFVNNTEQTFQLIVYTDEKYLNAELRAEKQVPHFFICGTCQRVKNFFAGMRQAMFPGMSFLSSST